MRTYQKGKPSAASALRPLAAAELQKRVREAREELLRDGAMTRDLYRQLQELQETPKPGQTLRLTSELVRAELDVNPDLWFFKCHFIGDPVMPGCLGVDAVWQMLGFFLCWDGSPGKGRALGCGGRC